MCHKHHEIPDIRVHFLAYLEKRSENLRKFSHCKLRKDVYCSAPNTEESLEYWVRKNTTVVCPISSLLTRKWRVTGKCCKAGLTSWPILLLVNDQHDAQILFYVFISISNSPHVLSTSCSSSGETNFINTSSGNSHSVLVAEMCGGWKSNLHTSRPPT